MKPLVVLEQIAPGMPGEDDRRGYEQRIRESLSHRPLAIPLTVLESLGRLRGARSVRCAVAKAGCGYTLVAVGSERSYSLALDLGSTNLVLLLRDNCTGRTVLIRNFENPQIAFGSDILTRMHRAMSPDGHVVYEALKAGVNRAIGAVCREAGVAVQDVHALAAAGNTAMTHFFLGLDVSSIPAEPFSPIVRTPGFLNARELGLGIAPEAPVYLFPNAGSYVGGDIVAGIIASGLHRSEKPAALIDVGTNAEVVIGTRDWMLVGAGAAGPALEEGICGIGRRASTGIIYDIEIGGGAVRCRTFDEQPPRGICGSGMVSLLAELFRAGVIDRRGMLDPARPNVTRSGGEAAYAIPCAGADPLLIRQSEIDNFMKSKAAMFTLLLVLTRSVGIGFRDVERVYVSGALGSGIDAARAVAIGMLPAWPADAVRALGNTSLEGARMLLENADLVETIEEVAGKITYKHMHDDPEFMKEYLGAVFIPHTNPELLKAE